MCQITMPHMNVFQYLQKATLEGWWGQGLHWRYPRFWFIVRSPIVGSPWMGRRMLKGIVWDIHNLRNPNMATSRNEILGVHCFGFQFQDEPKTKLKRSPLQRWAAEACGNLSTHPRRSRNFYHESWLLGTAVSQCLVPLGYSPLTVIFSSVIWKILYFQW